MVANKTNWMLDIGASRHLCANKELFHDFEESTDGECVYMCNSTTTRVMGKGKILLKLTSRKALALNNVLYVPSLRRNLVSSALLNKAGLKLIFEYDKVVISRGGDFVGKGYLSGGLFVLNITQKITNNASTFNSAYISESIDLRHDILAPVRTPYDSSIHLRKNKEFSVSQTEYAKIIGRVMFLMNYTRSDIAYAVSRLSRYTHNLSSEHWNALYRLLRYLRGTISWKSSKQTCIAGSTMKYEFIALELVGQEAEWLRNFLVDVPLWRRQASPVSLYCDSQEATGIARNSIYNRKRRYIRIRHDA
uniref:Uncharacterized protein LOC104232850 n=1 Tax=Nicotiana sylvestris TaxID=4096 RepID=A0A1U7XD95_NICSY